MNSFTYSYSRKLINWGMSFDSLLELKYVFSIRKEYEFLRSYIPIFYDPRTRLPTNYIRDNIRRYTPDFLIRHKVTKQAFLIETKPREYQHQEQLVLRKEVAENYIRLRKYDWTFKVVFDDEVILTEDEQVQFDQWRKLIPSTNFKKYLQRLNDRYDRTQSSVFKSPPSNRLVQFVMFGDKLPERTSAVG